jgi:hypothetical protein
MVAAATARGEADGAGLKMADNKMADNKTANVAADAARRVASRAANEAE